MTYSCNTENKTAAMKKKALPPKQFQIQNSPLTDLLETNHIQTIYHIFLASFFGLFLNNIIGNYVKNGEFYLGLKLIKLGFGDIHIAIITWIGFFCTTCLCYVCFKCWAKSRLILSAKIKTLLDILFILCLFWYICCSFALAVSIVFIFELPPASSAIIIIEKARTLVKIYAFVRSNVPKVLHRENLDHEPKKLPDFLSFLYFLFAPTLVYHDDYPRSPIIHWRFVIERALEIICVIFYYSFVIERYFITSYHDFGLQKLSWGAVILSLFENAIAGVLILLTSFYMILHSWLNLFAELMRFGDRLFYQDWWNANSASDFFRKWNLVVNNWFYMYMYKDLYENIKPLNRMMAKFMVFVSSAVVHEVLIWLSLRFCLPALIFEYLTFGVIVSCCVACSKCIIPKFLFWYGIAFGVGHIISLYAMEMALRINVPNSEVHNVFVDFFTPRLLNTTNYIDYS